MAGRSAATNHSFKERRRSFPHPCTWFARKSRAPAYPRFRTLVRTRSAVGFCGHAPPSGFCGHALRVRFGAGAGPHSERLSSRVARPGAAGRDDVAIPSRMPAGRPPGFRGRIRASRMSTLAPHAAAQRRISSTVGFDCHRSACAIACCVTPSLPASSRCVRPASSRALRSRYPTTPCSHSGSLPQRLNVAHSRNTRGRPRDNLNSGGGANFRVTRISFMAVPERLSAPASSYHKL
jgi:hypothetical protein